MTDDKFHISETPDNDPRGSDDYEEQWQQLDGKVLLAQCLTELQQIRLLLQGTEMGEDTTQRMFECKRCEATVKADERQRHATSKHKAPSDMVESLFTEK